MVVSSIVWTKHRNATDGRTDGRTGRIAVAITALCIAGNVDRRAVKTTHNVRLASMKA